MATSLVGRLDFWIEISPLAREIVVCHGVQGVRDLSVAVDVGFLHRYNGGQGKEELSTVQTQWTGMKILLEINNVEHTEAHMML